MMTPKDRQLPKTFIQTKDSDTRCFSDASKGLDENCQPADAKLRGDTTNSARPKMNNDGMLVDGPFGGKKPQS